VSRYKTQQIEQDVTAFNSGDIKWVGVIKMENNGLLVFYSLINFIKSVVNRNNPNQINNWRPLPLLLLPLSGRSDSR